jgi:PGF-pre-PGF domain-containing protein
MGRSKKKVERHHGLNFLALAVVIIGLVLLFSYGGNEVGGITGADVYGVVGDIQGTANGTQCGNVATTATLTADVSSGGHCFNITGQNAFINCQGHRVDYGADGGDFYGINNTLGFDNLTVINCNFRKDLSNGGAGSFGAILRDSENSTLANNTFYIDGSGDAIGVYLISSTNTRLENNSIYTNGTGLGNLGFYIHNGSSRTNITGNNMTTNGTSSNYGVKIDGGSNFSYVVNNTIRTDGSSSDNVGIYMLGWSRNNTISQNSIFTNGTSLNMGILLGNNNSYNIIVNNRISTDGTADLNDGIRIEGSSHNNTITDNTIITNGTQSNTGILLSAASENIIQNNTITTQGTSTNNNGFIVSSTSLRNRVIHNTITASGLTPTVGIELSTGSNHTLLDSNLITLLVVGEGILLTHPLANTTLVNNNISAQAQQNIFISDMTSGDHVNYLIYNNSFGEIRWMDNGSGSFLRNLTFNITNGQGFGLDLNLFIGNETIALNTSAFDIKYGRLANATANISLFGLGLEDVTQIIQVTNYTTVAADINSSGTDCLSVSCTFGSYFNGTLIFNVSHFSSFRSANGGVLSSDTTAPSVTVDCGGPYVIGDTISCSCTASDAVGVVGGANFNGGSSTETGSANNAGTFESSICAATDAAGNRGEKRGTYVVSEGESGGAGVSGGSGGSSRGSVSVSENLIWDRLVPGKVNPLPLKKDFGITEIGIDVLEEVKDAKVTVERTTAGDVFSGISYRRLEITSDVEVSEVTFKFKVSKLWMAENQLLNDDVALYRYETNWVKLPTSIVRDDGTFTYFSATSPGLSFFIIGGEPLVAQVVPAIEETQEQISIPEEFPSVKVVTGNRSSSGALAGRAFSTATGEKSPWVFIVITILTLMILVAIAVMHFWRRDVATVEVAINQEVEQPKVTYLPEVQPPKTYQSPWHALREKVIQGKNELQGKKGLP